MAIRLTAAMAIVLLVGCGQRANDRGRIESTATNQLAPEPPRDIVGFTLGEQRVIPECKKVKEYGMITYAYPQGPTPCWTNDYGDERSLKSAPDFPHGPRHEGLRSVHLGTAAVPEFVDENADILILNKKVEELRLDTAGADVQDAIYMGLVIKYGPPTYTNSPPDRPHFGALHASWEFPSMSVRYYGYFDDPRKGAIIASSPAAEKWWAARQPKHADGF